jgi:hypothetical protein
MLGMSKAQTSHEPDPDELAHAADAGHDADDQGHGSDVLGPVDVEAWGAVLIGVAAGLVIVLCLVLTTSILG